MSMRWKRPSRVEIARIRAECVDRGIGDERAEMIVADARRSPQEAERHDAERLARLEAEWAERPTRTGDELRAWHDGHRGFRPPRRLPPDAAVCQPGAVYDYRNHMPFAPKPWFWIEATHSGSAAWDGRCFVRGGWEEVAPRPRGYHESSALAFLYPSAGECLSAAARIDADTGTECEVHAYPSEAYYPPWETRSGVVLDPMRLTWWVRLFVRCANSHYNAGIDPRTPLPHWVVRDYLPRGTVYPENGLCFWHHDCTLPFWHRLQREYAPPTYVEILDRRGDRQRQE